jgi:hypothetical protein
VDIANVEAYVGLRFSPAQFDAAGVICRPTRKSMKRRCQRLT